MSHSDADSFCVVAGDMPFIDIELVLEQIEVFRTRGCEVLIPLLNGFISLFKASFRRAVVNINTSGDLKIAENMYLDRG